MAHRIARSPEDLKREDERRAHKFPFAQAMRPCTNGLADPIAERLGRTAYAPRTVNTWQNFNDPQRGPNEVLYECMAVAIESGKSLWSATAPLRHLCELMGGSFVVDPGDTDDDGLLLAGDRIGATSLRETGEALLAFAHAIEDGHITGPEAATAKNELAQARAALATAERFIDSHRER